MPSTSGAPLPDLSASLYDTLLRSLGWLGLAALVCAFAVWLLSRQERPRLQLWQARLLGPVTNAPLNLRPVAFFASPSGCSGWSTASCKRVRRWPRVSAARYSPLPLLMPPVGYATAPRRSYGCSYVIP